MKLPRPTFRELGFLALAVLPFVLSQLVQGYLDPPVATGDPYHYLMHARALSEGRGYTDIEYIATDLTWGHGPQVQPPGLPLLLAPVMAVFGSDSPLVALVMVLFSVVFVGMVWAWGRSVGGEPFGVALAWMVAAIREFMESAPLAYSDVPHAIAIWTVILMLRGDQLSTKTLVAVGVMGMAASATRLFGVSVLATMALYGLIKKTHRRLLWLVGGLGTIGLGTAFVTGLYLDRFQQLILALPGLLYFAWGRAWDYQVGLFNTLLYPFPLGLVSDVYRVLAVVLVIVGLVVWVRRNGMSFALVFAGVYGIMLVLAPVEAVPRYLLPVVPVVLFGLLFGLQVAWERLLPNAGQPRVAAAAIGMVLAVLSIPRSLALPVVPTLANEPDVAAMVEYFGERTGPAQVIFVQPRYLGWATRHPSMAVPPTEDPTVLLEAVDEFGITHVVTSDLRPDLPQEQVFGGLVRALPERFEPEFEAGRLTVYRVVPATNR